jgi:hypothetical protein
VHEYYSIVLNNNSGATLNNYGNLENNSVLNNNSGGTLNNNSGGTLNNNAVLSNAGTLYNYGIINGTGNYTQTAGLTKNMGRLTQAAININGGILSGTGQIYGPVTIGTGGTVSPGDAPGTLTIYGNFISSGNLLFDIDGLGSGHQSVLDIIGNATFNGGNITFDFINGYRPSAGDSWSGFLFANNIYVLNAPSFNVEGPTGLDWNFNPYTETLSISYVPPVPIPAAFWLLSSGLLGLVGIRKRFKS